jgi:hypothetical protein
LKDFLAGHSKDLHAVEAEFLASPPPLWGFDASDLPNRQLIANVLGLIRLQRALLAEALAESFGGNASAAGRALEASWRLNQTLRGVPDVSCQIIALAIARMQAGALRKIDIDAGLWRKRLAEHDFKRSAFDTQLLALWPSPERYRRLEEMELRSERNLFKRLDTLLQRPYGNIVWADVIEGMRLDYLRVRDSQPLSAGDVPERKAGAKSSSADIIRSIQTPNLLNEFRRVDSFVLDAELTDKVLEARQLRQQNGGKWPAAIPGIETTRLPGARWIYSVSPGGAMSLSLSTEPHWDQGGLILPLRFTSS